jgi:hypothetical protein
MGAARTSETSVNNYFTFALMIEAARTSETSVGNYFTSSWWWRQDIPLKRLSTIILHRPDDWGSTYLWNVGLQLFYIAMVMAARTYETSVNNYFTSPWRRQDIPLKRRSTIILHRRDDWGSTYLWNVGLQLFYIAMVGAVRTSETSVNNYFTSPWWWRQDIPLKRRSTIILHSPWWWRQHIPPSVDNYSTRQYIPEDNSELHTRRRENLKSHRADDVNETVVCVMFQYMYPTGEMLLPPARAKSNVPRRFSCQYHWLE